MVISRMLLECTPAMDRVSPWTIVAVILSALTQFASAHLVSTRCGDREPSLATTDPRIFQLRDLLLSAALWRPSHCKFLSYFPQFQHHL
jgi:hypothetical protein